MREEDLIGQKSKQKCKKYFRILIGAALMLSLLIGLDTQAAWKQRGNNWYYYSSSGRLQKSRFIDHWYVNKDGVRVRSFVYTRNGYRWKTGSHSYLKNSWKTIDKNRYYFDAKGYMVTRKWVDGKYLQSDGTCLKGLVRVSGRWHLTEAGKTYAKNKWKTINSRRCYFDKNGFRISNRRVTIKGIRYSFDKSGYMKAGTRVSSKGTRYQNADGSYLKNKWKKLSGKWHYYGSDGYMVKNKTVGRYYLDKYGNRAVSTWVKGSFVDKDGFKVSESSLNLTAPSAILMDAGTGKVIYQKNANVRRPNASTTKIMTAILALEKASVNDLVQVSSNASLQEPSKLYIQQGESYRMSDLLYALLLPSCNDVAVAIAEHVGGSESNFAAMMNQKAWEIGCTNTYFVTPSGLDAWGHGSTASDLAKMARYAMRKTIFKEIINTRSYGFSCPTSGRSFYVENSNSFLNQMNGAMGVKTGFTTPAGYCFVGALKNGDKTYISVVLGCPDDNAKWSDTRKLMNFAIRNY